MSDKLKVIELKLCGCKRLFKDCFNGDPEKGIICFIKEASKKNNSRLLELIKKRDDAEKNN